MKNTNPVQHFASSVFQGWQTPKPIIDLAVELAIYGTAMPLVDLCGMSRYLPQDSWSLATEEFGISTFLQSKRLMVSGGPSPVFANPPYGYIRPQCSLEPYTRDHGVKGLLSAIPGLTLTKGINGNVHLVNNKSLHSCDTFARWIIWMYETYRIASAFLVVPSSTDAIWHRNIFLQGDAICVDTQRIPFELTDESGENYVPKSGNTKGTSIFWFPPRQSRKESVRLLYDKLNGDFEFPYQWVAKQQLVAY
jgi:hypothetical protein